MFLIKLGPNLFLRRVTKVNRFGQSSSGRYTTTNSEFLAEPFDSLKEAKEMRDMLKIHLTDTHTVEVIQSIQVKKAA